ncbi:hypothetical protein GEU84_005595 [Fertoebacter nigrum]|uniref:Uncharacterized protein n=1 Tax=Fertoeibacter niger TaxID=2656921 RepID=A0A8X8GT44_9RHOB|nr:hypothetical protein [Fertoeibacter niger]NUB43848.1 hypothetical protein [Fertoeibacter niger]
MAKEPEPIGAGDLDQLHQAARARGTRFALRLSWAAVVLNLAFMVLALEANGYLF